MTSHPMPVMPPMPREAIKVENVGVQVDPPQEEVIQVATEPKEMEVPPPNALEAIQAIQEAQVAPEWGKMLEALSRRDEEYWRQRQLEEQQEREALVRANMMFQRDHCHRLLEGRLRIEDEASLHLYMLGELWNRFKEALPETPETAKAAFHHIVETLEKEKGETLDEERV